MDNKITQLKRLQREINYALSASSEAEKSAKEAENAYGKALAQWEAENKLLVDARNTAIASKKEAAEKVKSLREEAQTILRESFLENLPEGFTQKRGKVVKYDPQGFTRIAHQYFPFLLVLDDKAVQKFFADQAKEQDDGSLILPENIRAYAAVEVIYEPKPEISDTKLSNLVFEDEPEETEEILEVVETESVEEAWTAPENATSFLTALPSEEKRKQWYHNMPQLNHSPEDESLPLGESIEDDYTILSEVGETKNLVPPTEEIMC